MNKLFEKFLSNFVKKHWAKISHNIEYLKDSMVSLQCEIKEGLYGIIKPLIPDIVIKRMGKILLIIDIKYKLTLEEPEREDCYQMYVYSKKLKCKKSLMLYPTLKSHLSKNEEKKKIKKRCDRDEEGEYYLFWDSINLNIDLF